MLLVFIKCVITFILVLVVVRIMGKRQLGEMQPFELVITLIIAEVACIPMNDPNIPFYNSIVPIVSLGMLHLFLSLICRKSCTLRKLVSGKSVIAIDKDGINYKNLKKMNMNISDLIEAVRASGYPDFSQIEYAIFETNGKVSVIEKPSDPTKIKEAYFPISLFMDGKWNEENMSLAEVKKPTIAELINKKGIKKFKDILYIDVRQDGTIYVSPKYEKCFTQKIKLSGGKNW